jgi:hypothetical protein
MELNGRTVNFRRSVWTTSAIMQMCPGGDLSRFGELFESGDQIINMSAFITIMSEGYEQFAEFEARRKGETYTKQPITMEELMALSDLETFNKLAEAAMAVWIEDGKTTVESEPPKSKKKVKAAKG